MEIGDRFKEQHEFFLRRGFSGRVGFGENPAILVIDFIKAFTDPSSPLGATLIKEMEQTLKILKLAREKGVPIIYTTVGYEPGYRDAGLWIKKIPSSRILELGSVWGEVDPMLERRAEESIVTKKYASAFFGTDLVSRLVSQRVDTTIITGCTTSGCVRASAIDALNYGFHSIVVGDAVGDRAIPPHEASLFDLDAKYADVVSTDDVLSYLVEIGNR